MARTKHYHCISGDHGYMPSESFASFCPELAYLFPAILKGSGIELNRNHVLAVALRNVYGPKHAVWGFIIYD